jgi:uncharacterized protein YegP (UPF0339 family)
MTDRIRFHREKSGDWRWTRTAPNGEIVGAASEGYRNLDDAITNAERINGARTTEWVYDWSVPT